MERASLVRVELPAQDMNLLCPGYTPHYTIIYPPRTCLYSHHPVFPLAVDMERASVVLEELPAQDINLLCPGYTPHYTIIYNYPPPTCLYSHHPVFPLAADMERASVVRVELPAQDINLLCPGYNPHYTIIYHYPPPTCLYSHHPVFPLDVDMERASVVRVELPAQDINLLCPGYIPHYTITLYHYPPPTCLYSHHPMFPLAVDMERASVVRVELPA